MHADDEQQRVLVLVSRMGHCLNDLLYRWRSGYLPGADRRGCVQPRRPAVADRVVRRPVPPSAGDDGHARSSRSSRSCSSSTQLGVDLVVLARYMQVLSTAALRCATGSHHQHPPLVPAELSRRPALRPGLRARREADRRDRALRHRGARRRPDHRAGSRAGRSCARPRRSSPQSAATWSASHWRARCAGISSTASCSTVSAPSCFRKRSQSLRSAMTASSASNAAAASTATATPCAPPPRVISPLIRSSA